MLTHLLVFAAGFIDEALAVFWVHNSERGQAFKTGVCAGLQGLAGTLMTVAVSFTHDWHYGTTFSAGLAMGAGSAVWFNTWRAS